MNLVLSGGGIKGICYLSIIKYLDEHKLIKKFKNFAGTSIGILFCLLILLEYKYNELESIIINGNVLKKIYDVNIFNFFDNYSVCNPNTLRKILEILINNKLNKKNITLLELYNITNKNLNIIVTNISNGEEKILNKDLTPDYDLIDSIIASCTLPGLYPPMKINDEHLIDGFLVNNYPIDIFKNDIENTIGIRVTEKKYYKEFTMNNYIYNIFSILTQNKENINRELYIKNIKKDIYLENDIFVLDIDIKKDKIVEIINNCYNILKNNIDTFS